jgi:Stress-induced bacterial acidophilic repeat motif
MEMTAKTNKTIERVARAICRQRHLDEFDEPMWSPGEIDAKVEAYWPKSVELARAALRAIRKPVGRPSEGGKARAAKLSPERRSEIARQGGKARWGREQGAP